MVGCSVKGESLRATRDPAVDPELEVLVDDPSMVRAAASPPDTEAPRHHASTSSATSPTVNRQDVYRVLMIGDWWFARDIDRWMTTPGKGSRDEVYSVGDEECGIMVKICAGRRDGIFKPGRQKEVGGWTMRTAFHDMVGTQAEADQWLNLISDFLESTPPDVIFVMMAEEAPLEDAGGTLVEYGTPAWQAAYEPRLKALLRTLDPAHRRVLWFVPPDETASHDAPGRWGPTRRSQALVLESSADPVEYIDSTPPLVDDSGRFPTHIGTRPGFQDGEFQTAAHFEIISDLVWAHVLPPLKAAHGC